MAMADAHGDHEIGQGSGVSQAAIKGLQLGIDPGMRGTYMEESTKPFAPTICNAENSSCIKTLVGL